jgi:hypothetical protein
MKKPFFEFHRPQATRKKPEPPEAPWETALAAFFMVIVIAGGIALLVILDSAWAKTPQPETRCFDTAVLTERYCRTQSIWEITDEV